MQSVRVGSLPSIESLEPGQYCQQADGDWYAKTPNGLLVHLSMFYHVEEHEDGSITVQPAIMANQGDAFWRGRLYNGQWETLRSSV